MNTRIKILPDKMMKRIAAGEVIERPASIVKELLENCLDAQASRISLIVNNGGIDLIQLIDDGTGMVEEDALNCCKRHATSKVATYQDLESISTYGFRGEALASICSVSRMTVTTMIKGDNESTEVYLEDGEIIEVTKVAPRKGTKITVKDVFSHIPARRKFLKRPATELRYVISAFRKICLANPEVEFTLIVNGKKTFDLKKSNLEKRIQDLLGKEKVAYLMNIEKQNSICSLKGMISKPRDSVKSRDNQFLFLNGRYIVNKSLVHAILSAYQTKLARNEYPIYILFIEIDPRSFDVNVHPSKIEVRFRDERSIHNFIYHAVKEVLTGPTGIPEFNLVHGRKKSVRNTVINQADLGQLTLDVQKPADEDIKHYDHRKQYENFSFWQIHNRYILSQIKSGLTIIDQHVAHERILYEKALESLQRIHASSQQLLFPQTVQIPPDDYYVLTEILPYLEKIGFSLKEFGRDTVVIEAIPTDVKTGRERELLLEIIDSYKETKVENNDIINNIAKSFACKSAIKSGEKLSFNEMASLVDQLFATEDPFFCPHGRPVVINLTLDEIDKKFGR